MQKLFPYFILKTFLYFSILYIKLPHFDLISVLINIIDFAFKWDNKKCICFSGNTGFLCHKHKHFHFFTKNY